MKTRDQILAFLSQNKKLFRDKYHIIRIGIFGSFAREEQKAKSDVDIMIELNSERKYSMFDIIDISFLIEKQIGRKVDIVEKGYLKSTALKTATNDLIKIYG